jgi:hypothetical protein
MAEDVVFDYDGACEVARTLWRLADDMAAFRTSIKGRADDALADWRGPFRRAFQGKVNVDRADLNRDITNLRDGARQWAQAYAKACDQQNQAHYTRKLTDVKRKRDERNLLQDVAAAIIHDDLPLPRKRRPCPVPQPPAFAPTDKPKPY